MSKNRTNICGVSPTRLPPWLKQRIRESETVLSLKKLLREMQINTVCQLAGCPNITQCFQKFMATFMILGDICTRNCRFCGVSQGKPQSLDPDEPRRIGEAVRLLNLRHVVITSVTRDDLPDGGSVHFAKTVKAIHQSAPEVTVEVLVPDFQGCEDSLRTVLESCVDVLNHNVETVPRLYKEIRPEARFDRSVALLEKAKLAYSSLITKSGLMVGLGESKEEVYEVLQHLHSVDCDALTIGQYLAPNRQSQAVVEYILPEVFNVYRQVALNMGFRWVNAGPFVRSSFNAEKLMKNVKECCCD